MMGILIALAIVCVVCCLPVGVRLFYDASGGFVWLKFAFFRIRLYPKENNTQNEKTKKSNKGKKGNKKTTGGNMTDFLPIVRVVFDFLSDFRRRLWVQNLYLRLTLADNDPYDLAVHYGEACGALEGLLPLLEQYVKIKNRDLRIDCDFIADKTKIVASADILISFGSFVVIAIRHGIRGFKKYQLLSKKIKAVQ